MAAAACLLVAAASAQASSQTRNVETPARQAAPRAAESGASGASADEDFELNIGERRISESDLRAETAVEAGGAGGLRLKVGVELQAHEIEVLLHGVRGRVRFRGSLAPVLRLLDARRVVAPEAPRPPGTSP